MIEEIRSNCSRARVATNEGTLYYARLEALAARRGIPVRPLTDLEILELDGARVWVLHSGGRRRKTDAVNNQSVVALSSAMAERALLTGDAGIPTETDLIQVGALTRVDVLKVGHHGADLDVRGIRGRPPSGVALLSCGRATDTATLRRRRWRRSRDSAFR